MKQLIISLLLLFVSTMPCLAYSKQMIKANKALLALEKNANATAKDRQDVADQLQAVINTASDIADKCEASAELGEVYSVHVPVQLRDYAKAAEYYSQACELISKVYGDEKWAENETVKNLKYRAFYNTAYYRYFKRSPTQDIAKALEYFIVAAENNPSCANNIGEIYEFGIDCDIDPDQAMEYYSQAIYKGQDCYAKYFSAEYFINQITSDSLDSLAFDNFREGILQIRMGMEKLDYDKIKECLTTAAERGYVPAQYELGTQYKQEFFPGMSNADNMRLAEQWLKKAADAGYVPAIHNLGHLYEITSHDAKGQVTSEGRAKALPYYERAAIGGFPPSQCALAVFYYMGFGGKEKDLDAAEFWLECSADEGYQLAQSYLNNLKNEKDLAEQRKQAQKNKSTDALSALANSLNSLAISMNSLANTVAKTSLNQSKMTTAQASRMQRASYSSSSAKTTKSSSLETCSRCKGSGKCSSQSASANKHYCHGSRKCGYCNGTGQQKGFGNTFTCVTCKGTTLCTYCAGTGECPKCHGTRKL